MKYDYLKEVAVNERPKMLVPDWDKKYFQGYYSVFIFLIISVGFINTSAN
ncbi:MAG: hypothetical protein GY749_49355 [Desulfobacteraceae bacterium]|nr:hypothetical protein [Desulfobacteraceae bacterium]